MDDDMVWITEGFVMNDAGNLITTIFVDLRDPEDRAPIESLVRGCERMYALEDCETILISQPARYRSFGEELVLDVQEGLAKEESVVSEQETPAQAARLQATSDLNQAFGLLDSQMRLSHSESHSATNWHGVSITYGKEWWIFCASMEPANDAEWSAWRGTLPNSYDHVSAIGQPAKFAQALAHMVAEQIGPRGQEGSMRDTSDGAETEESLHRTQWVIHGPVIYVDSVYDTLNEVSDNRRRLVASVFTKSKAHAAQKEYRFAVLNEGADEETVILEISGMMRDALKYSGHGFVRQPPAPLNADSRQPRKPSQGASESLKSILKKTTWRERSAEREEWRIETRGRNGEVLSSDGGLRESVKERTVAGDHEPVRGEFQKMPSRNLDDSEVGDTAKTATSLDATWEHDKDQNDGEAVKRLALEEFDLDNKNSEGANLSIPIRTVTGRVYKSFEEMLSDPTHPMTPMGKIWEEDAYTPDEIIKTYRAIAVLNLKMHDIKEHFRQDLASAGWHAMLCIRNIYSRLGDIVDTISIENDRFVVIRLRPSDALNATGRIVIAPSGAYAYSLHLPGMENVGYGGLEWGTMFFPIGTQVETFVEYGWKKKVI